jgi:hypothetical protein
LLWGEPGLPSICFLGGGVVFFRKAVEAVPLQTGL